MAKKVLGVVAGLATWVIVASLIGRIMRASWPEYAIVEKAMTFTLAMMIARLSIGAFATVCMGAVTSALVPSPLARLMPGVLMLVLFIPVHVMLWENFPVWYHLFFLLSLVPLTYAGGRLTQRYKVRLPAERIGSRA